MESGEVLHANSRRSDVTAVDCFLTMFPMNHLSLICDLTNENLREEGFESTSSQEILKFFGVLIIITRFQFSNRRDLWKRTPMSKYIPSAEFGKFITRDRFERLMRNIQFSVGTDPSRNGSVVNQDEGEVTRWGLVSEFLDAINEHRKRFVRPSDSICVDESMSRWYGAGGSWCGIGLPHYFSIDRKPESGCGLHSLCNGVSGILLGLKLVTGARKGDELETFGEQEIKPSKPTTMELIRPWLNANRLVCADSCFSSVATAAVLYKQNTRYIGLVKNRTKEYPMIYLSTLQVSRREEYRTLVSADNNNNMNFAAVF